VRPGIRGVTIAVGVALALLASGPTLAAPGPGSGAGQGLDPQVSSQPNAVTWAVDDAARTITATVRLQLGSTCTRAAMVAAVAQGPAAAARCKVSDAVVKAIRDNVDAVWNTGQTFLCYRLAVVMDITVADPLVGAAAGSAAAPADREFVAIDQTPVGIRSFVSADTPAGSSWSLNGPETRLVPTNGAEDPSTWKFPPTWETSLYAHEVAHVLGMSDQYEDYVDATDGKTYSSPKQGAPDDVMSNVTSTRVDPSTMQRLVLRAGVDPVKLKCDWTIHRVVPGGKITGTKCGGIGGDWVIDADVKSGPATVHQRWTVTIDAGTRAGTFTYADTGHTEMLGSTADTKGSSSGTASLTLDLTGPVTTDLHETVHTSTGQTTAAGQTIRMPLTDVPPVDYTFKWEPTVCP
jgi:hypothetical protein